LSTPALSCSDPFAVTASMLWAEEGGSAEEEEEELGADVLAPALLCVAGAAVLAVMASLLVAKAACC
jgi:hypothetical protein